MKAKEDKAAKNIKSPKGKRKKKPVDADPPATEIHVDEDAAPVSPVASPKSLKGKKKKKIDIAPPLEEGADDGAKAKKGKTKGKGGLKKGKKKAGA